MKVTLKKSIGVTLLSYVPMDWIAAPFSMLWVIVNGEEHMVQTVYYDPEKQSYTAILNREEYSEDRIQQLKAEGWR